MAKQESNSYPITSLHDSVSYNLLAFVTVHTKKPVEISYLTSESPKCTEAFNKIYNRVKLLDVMKVNDINPISFHACNSSSNSLKIIWLAVWDAIADETGARLVQCCMARGATQARWMELVIRMHPHYESIHDWFLASVTRLRR